MIWFAVFLICAVVAVHYGLRLAVDLAVLAAMTVCAVIGGIIKLVGGDHGEARRN